MLVADMYICFFNYKNYNAWTIVIDMQAAYNRPVTDICFYFSNYKNHNAGVAAANMLITRVFY